MSELSRRDVLRRLALALTAAGTLDRVSAQEVHQMAARSTAAGATGYFRRSRSPIPSSARSSG